MRLLAIAVAAFAASATATALAQQYPSKPIRVITANSAGGTYRKARRTPTHSAGGTVPGWNERRLFRGGEHNRHEGDVTTRRDEGDVPGIR